MKARRLLFALLAVGLSVKADEGMWTFDNPPVAQIKAKYNFAPDEKWLEHVRLAAVEFGGGSGAFVSKDGLVMTNHHVGRRSIEKVSESGKKDYVKNGFLAKTRSEEIKIPDLRLYTLMQMVNVTDKVNAVVKPGMDEKQAMKARSEKFIRLRDDLDQRGGLAAWHVCLYKGGEYWLYAYKVHRDVRLVMAPESQIAFFGGDPDNFTYPRHDLDFSLFRVYEGGEPYNPPHYLKWANDGLKPGDLTFVVGSPGRTSRLETIAQMKYQRDIAFPGVLTIEEAHCAALHEYGKGSEERARKIATDIFSAENRIKAVNGELAGLLDPSAFSGLEKKENDLQAAVAKNPQLQSEAGQSWTRIEEAVGQMKPLAQVGALINSRKSKLLQTALDLVCCVQELDKPVDQRLDGYRTKDDIEYAKWRLERSIPFDDMEMETFLITKGLEDIQKQLPPEHPYRKAVLGDKSPVELAKEIVAGTKVQFMYIRRDLVVHGSKGVAKSQDPLVQLARNIESFASDMKHKREDLQAIIDEHTGRIARARFALLGKTLYPDATESLRFSFGVVEGYTEQGTSVPPFTTFGDLYERALMKGPEAGNGAWALPAHWQELKGQLDLKTPLNFCHKVDIVGGNSGSPVINIQGEFVGVIFDGNLQSLPGRFYYDENVNRAVSVDCRAIVEALSKVYNAQHLVNEVLPN